MDLNLYKSNIHMMGHVTCNRLQSILNGPKKSIRLGALFHAMGHIICNGLQSIWDGPKKMCIWQLCNNREVRYSLDVVDCYISLIIGIPQYIEYLETNI